MNVTLFLTHQCNLRCDYCYNGEKLDRAMPDSVARRGVELAFSELTTDRSEPVLIRFFGGEPLLELPLIRSSVAHARTLAAEGGMPEPTFSVTTNGTLLDSETAARLERDGLSVAVSFDGCREAQDAHRRYANGTSSYDATLRGLRVALAELTSVETCSVIEPDTVSLLPESLDELLGLGVSAITFTPNYEAPWSEGQLGALERALDPLGDRLVASYRSGQPVTIEPYDSKIRSHIGGGFPQRCRCPFGRGELAVAPSGRLYPCDRLVRQDDSNELCIGHLDTGVDQGKVKALRGALAEPDTECQRCQLKDRCMHWCGCVNVMTSGQISTPSPTVCRLEQLLIQSADRVAATLYAESNPAFMQRFYP